MKNVSSDLREIKSNSDGSVTSVWDLEEALEEVDVRVLLI